MAGPFYVDDGGDGTTETSWATADTSINALDAEYTFASGEIVYFGHDHVCQATNSATLTITGPASGEPVYFISATQGSSPPTYAASSSNQIDTTEGAYRIVFDGSFACYGMQIAAGSQFQCLCDANESQLFESCTIKLGVNGYFILPAGGSISIVNTTIDLAAESSNQSNEIIYAGSAANRCEFINCTIANGQYRQAAVFSASGVNVQVQFSGCDFTSLTNATLCELVGSNLYGSSVTFSNCITAATWAPSSGNFTSTGVVEVFNCGPANAPTYYYKRDLYGTIVSSSEIYRTGGADVGGAAMSFSVITPATYASEASPLYTPWIYFDVDSTGSKTFDVYITNDTADFTDAQVWLEVEYFSTTGEADMALATGHRTITTTAATTGRDDTTSTWNGTGPSFTYKQKISASATVNVAGMHRARVAVGVASIADTRYFYIDPKVTVT